VCDAGIVLVLRLVVGRDGKEPSLFGFRGSMTVGVPFGFSEMLGSV